MLHPLKALIQKGYVVGIAQLRDCFLANRDTTDTLISQHPFPYCVEKDQEEERAQGVTLVDSVLEGEPSRSALLQPSDPGFSPIVQGMDEAA